MLGIKAMCVDLPCNIKSAVHASLSYVSVYAAEKAGFSVLQHDIK